MHPRSRRFAVGLVALVLAGSGLLACGGDDEGDGGESPTTGAAAGVDLCDAFEELRGQVAAANELFEDPDADDAAAREAVAEIFESADTALQALPEDLQDDGDAVRQELDELEEQTADADIDELRVVLPVEMGAIFLADSTDEDTPASRILAHTAAACPQG